MTNGNKPLCTMAGLISSTMTLDFRTKSNDIHCSPSPREMFYWCAQRDKGWAPRAACSLGQVAGALCSHTQLASPSFPEHSESPEGPEHSSQDRPSLTHSESTPDTKGLWTKENPHRTVRHSSCKMASILEDPRETGSRIALGHQNLKMLKPFI